MKADPQQTHIANQWPHTSPLIACRFDPTGSYVFASTEDYAVQRWRLSDGQKVSYPALHDSWVGALAFLPDGRTLITGGFDGRIMWWPATDAKPTPIRSIQAHAGWVRTLAISPDGKWLASGGNDHLVKIYNAADGTLVRELAGHQSHVYSTLFHPSGTWILSGDLQGEIRQWDVHTGKTVRTFDGKALHTYEASQQVDYGGIRSLTLTADGKHLAAGGLYNATNPLGAVNDPLVLLFQWSDQKKLRSHVIGGVQGIIWRVIGHPDGFLVGGCGGSSGGFIAFWKTDADKEFFKLPMPNVVRDLDLHPDGIRLATANSDRQLRILRMGPKVG
jgi:WD40 repeat protein